MGKRILFFFAIGTRILTSIYINSFFYSNIQYHISSTNLYPVEKNNYSFSSRQGWLILQTLFFVNWLSLNPKGSSFCRMADMAHNTFRKLIFYVTPPLQSRAEPEPGSVIPTERAENPALFVVVVGILSTSLRTNPPCVT